MSSPAPDCPPPAPSRTALLVLGMHRSGTSILTRLIGSLGAALPHDAAPAGPDNVEGYWEPLGLVALNDRLLAVADSAWLDPRPLDLSRVPDATGREIARLVGGALRASFADAPLFVLKDPRICRMMPFYRPVLAAKGAAAKVVLALREPPDVAASLLERNQLSPDFAGLLWARHLVDAERDSRDLPRIVVAYGELLEDWHGPAGRLARLLGRAPAAGDPPAGDLVRPALRHHRAGSYAIFSPPVGRLLAELQAAALGLDDVGPAAAAATFDDLAAELAAMTARLADLLTVEFQSQRLSSPHPPARPIDTAAARRDLAQAMQRLHRARPESASASDQAAAQAVGVSRSSSPTTVT
ncbi:hypothetical protein STHU_09770 [Allostella humosa]|uniref:sulfotransferase family protein n=1 Tax=Stella humosa TaxID=94 RepID=UPI0011339C97|nr:sulfotransferase family protein [Stella humosa]BBK30343.1 hypothetical protein STHU_09770 [Stella humosa]